MLFPIMRLTRIPWFLIPQIGIWRREVLPAGTLPTRVPPPGVPRAVAAAITKQPAFGLFFLYRIKDIHERIPPGFWGIEIFLKRFQKKIMTVIKSNKRKNALTGTRVQALVTPRGNHDAITLCTQTDFAFLLLIGSMHRYIRFHTKILNTRGMIRRREK